MDEILVITGKSGFILFTLGLAIGAVIPKFRNSRMGLSAHLTAVQSGIGLIVFALFWPYLGLPEWAWTPVAVSLIASFYMLTSGLFLAAIFGASKNLPIAGKGFSSTLAKEKLVSVLVVGSSVWMLLTCLLVCLFFIVGQGGA